MDYENLIDMVERFFNGQYTVEKFLGEGSFAQVYLVKHNFLNDRRAIKIIKKSLTQTSNIDKIFREVRLATSLRHENIISIHDAGIITTYGYDSQGQFILDKNDDVHDDWAYFIIEYVSGGDLEDYRQSFSHSNINIPLMQVLNIIRQILSGLNTLHSASPPIVHRDLKTGNILMGFDSYGNMQLKISDFGFAKEVSSDINADEFGGTKLYMSPESFNRKFSTRSDVYAVGVIFYLLLTNNYPYDINGLSPDTLRDLSTWNLNVKKPSEYNTNVTPLIDEVILKSISVNPKDRYADAKEFLKKVEEVIDTLTRGDNHFFDDGVYQATSKYNQYNKLNINENIENAFKLAQAPGKLNDAIEVLEREIISDYTSRRNYTQILRMWKSQNPDIKLVSEAYKITLRAQNYKLASTFIKEAIAINPQLHNSYTSTVKVWDLLSKLEKDENLIDAVSLLEEYMEYDERIYDEYNQIINILKTYSVDMIVKEAVKLADNNKKLEAARLMEFAVTKDKKLKTEYASKISSWKQYVDI